MTDVSDKAAGDKVPCRTPASGRDGVTRIPRWKFEACRTAILSSVEAAGPDGLRFSDLKSEVGARLDADTLARLGSLGWHVTTVKLELECRGALARREGPGPQYLVLSRRKQGSA